jgi:hypothetical protein
MGEERRGRGGPFIVGRRVAELDPATGELAWRGRRAGRRGAREATREVRGVKAMRRLNGRKRTASAATIPVLCRAWRCLAMSGEGAAGDGRLLDEPGGWRGGRRH